MLRLYKWTVPVGRPMFWKQSHPDPTVAFLRLVKASSVLPVGIGLETQSRELAPGVMFGMFGTLENGDPGELYFGLSVGDARDLIDDIRKACIIAEAEAAANPCKSK